MSDILNDLNDEQRAAVTHEGEPMMVIAGAGTGKTTVMARRMQWLIQERGVPTDGILALTFTEKAATELEERMDRRLPYGHTDTWIHTFHGFCERILRDSGAHIGLSPDIGVINDMDAWLLMRDHLNAFSLERYRPLGNPTKFLRALLTHFSRAKDEGITPEQYQTHAASITDTEERTRVTELAQAYATYESLLHERHVLDFGGLLMYARLLLEQRPHILAQYQAQFQHVVVDEFQDTNPIQYALIRLLKPDGHGLVVVGDDDQAIYRFRGASLQNILQFERDYPNAQRVVLTTNYRSHQRILDAAYALIQRNNPQRLEVQGDQRVSKRLIARGDGEGQISGALYKTERAEALATIKEMRRVHNEGIPWDEIALLVRAHAHAEPFLVCMEEQGIPYAVHAMKGLYRLPIVLDIIALLHIVVQPHDSVYLYRWLSHPALGINPMALADAAYAARRRGVSLFECVRDVPAARPVIDLLRACQELAQRRNALEVLAFALKASGLYGWLIQQEEPLQSDGSAQVRQFYERVRRFVQHASDPSLVCFISTLVAEREAGESGDVPPSIQAGPDEVQILTVHASKGLEFRAVFLVNLVDKRFPSTRRREPLPLPEGLCASTGDESQHHLQDERRLFYVALTRARERVYLSGASHYGGVRTKRLSEFIEEAGVTASIVPVHTDQDTLTPVPLRTQESTSVARPPTSFSFTQLAAYTQCPLQYKFAHVLHIPTDGSPAFSFGQTMHRTLQSFFERWMARRTTPPVDATSMPSLSELMELYAQCWIDEWYEDQHQRETYRAQGEAQLRAYWAELVAQPPHPIAVEKEISLRVGDTIVRGRIDRLDAIEGGVEIVDYKTGTPKTAKNLLPMDRAQLLLYQIAVQDVLGLVPKRLTFCYLQNGSRVSFLGSERQMSAVRDRIERLAELIGSRQFEATPGHPCLTCAFRDICPFRA